MPGATHADPNDGDNEAQADDSSRWSSGIVLRPAMAGCCA
jgi:hypothetical protein